MITKQEIISLADRVRNVYPEWVVKDLAEWLVEQNPNFKPEKWYKYIESNAPLTKNIKTPSIKI